MFIDWKERLVKLLPEGDSGLDAKLENFISELLKEHEAHICQDVVKKLISNLEGNSL